MHGNAFRHDADVGVILQGKLCPAAGEDQHAFGQMLSGEGDTGVVQQIDQAACEPGLPAVADGVFQMRLA